MLLDENFDKLDWDNANILDWRYLNYLQRMIHERYIKIGCAPCDFPDFALNNVFKNFAGVEFEKNLIVWCPQRFSPGGFITWKQIQMIYNMTLFLATHVYLNEDNLKEENFENGDLKTFLSYTMPQLIELTGFDFYEHPFIPGQPILYYNKFLKPLKIILSNLKKIWSNNVDTTVNDIATGTLNELPNSYLAGDKTYSEKLSIRKNKDNWIAAMQDKFAEGREVNYGRSYFIYLGYCASFNYEESLVDNQPVGDCVYQTLTVNFSKTYRFRNSFIPNTNYDIYLISITNNFESYQGVTHSATVYKNSLEPYWHSTNWNNIIKVKSGLIPESGLLVERLSLPDWNLKIDFPKSEEYIEDNIWRNKYVYDSSTNGYSRDTNPYASLYFGRAACYYYPLVVLDYSSNFLYM